MRCPFCQNSENKVIDSRESHEGAVIRRRRECLDCRRRFTTYERVEELSPLIVKKDGRRERFDRQKALAGLLKACEKRPVSMIQLETIADKAEVMVQESSEREASTRSIGEMIMNELKNLDKVAYVRFASVYLDFKDVQEFMTELKDLLKTKEAPEPQTKSAAKH